LYTEDKDLLFPVTALFDGVNGSALVVLLNASKVKYTSPGNPTDP